MLLEKTSGCKIIKVIIYAKTLRIDESRPKLRKLRNQKQGRIKIYLLPQVKVLAPDKLRNTAFVFWNLSHVRAFNIIIFGSRPGAPYQ